MTSIVVKFPAQQVGSGGGVMARRRLRDGRSLAPAIHIVEPEHHVT